MRLETSKLNQIWNTIYRYIPTKLTQAQTWSLMVKRLVYILGVAWLCHLDRVVRTESFLEEDNLRNYTGVVIALIILTAYKLKDFMKIPYLVWTVLFFIGRHLTLQWGLDTGYVEYGRLEANVWCVGLYGLISIRMFIAWFMEKKPPRMHWGPFLLWMIMMLAMVILRWDIRWSKCFFVYFTFFYLTNYEEKDLNNLFSGVVEGLILGFLLVQGFAFFHRPYLEVRYLGAFCNSNNNALFYLVAYTAVLCKWYQMKLKRRFILFRLPLILLLGVIVSLTIFTMGRAAILVMIVNTVFFLVFQMLSRRRWKLLEAIIDGSAILLAILLTFMPTYEAVRWLPAYTADPVYFDEDYYKLKIHLEYDDMYSEKYIEFDEMWEEAFGRILWFLEESQVERIKNWFLRFTLVAEAASLPSGYDGDVWEEYDEVYVEPGTDKNHPILNNKEDATDSAKVRMCIYQYYMEHLEWFGARSGASEVWVSPWYSAPHPHNVLLFIAGDYGICVGVAFIVVILFMCHRVLMGLAERKQGAWYYRLFLLLGYTTVLVGFGMVELNWDYGQTSFTLFFLVQYVLHHRCLPRQRRKQRVEESLEAELDEEYGLERI